MFFCVLPQVVADQIDMQIAEGAADLGAVVGAWVTEWTLPQMRMTIELGFSLQLHSLHEYPHIFFYLSCLSKYGSATQEAMARAGLLSKRTLKKKGTVSRKVLFFVFPNSWNYINLYLTIFYCDS